MTYTITPLFSTPLYTSDTGRILTKSELKFIEDLPEKSLEMGNYGSVSTDLLEFPELLDLKNFCLTHLNRYVKDILQIEQEFYISQSWTTRNPTGTQHHDHDHPDSIFSGVYYPIAPSGNITLVHKRQFSKHMDFEYNFKTRNVYNCDTWEISVGDGLLVIFPSWVKHSIAPNTSNIDRRIIGFNTFTRGQFGIKNNVTWIDIK